MNYNEKCDHCGHQKTAYTFNLNVSLVRALRKLVDWHEKHNAPVMLEKLQLTNSQYTNFAHMKYFGLVENTETGWLPTTRGELFISGKITVTLPVAVIAEEILPDDHPAWNTHSRQRKTKHISQIDEISYKQKAEYQEEKAGTNSFL